MEKGSFSLVVIFKDQKNSDTMVSVPDFNFGGELSVLLEQIPSILRDIFKTPPRENLKLKALWWGESRWLSDPSFKFTSAFNGCLLVLVDVELASHGEDYYNAVAEAIIKQKGVNPRRARVLNNAEVEPESIAHKHKRAMHEGDCSFSVVAFFLDNKKKSRMISIPEYNFGGTLAVFTEKFPSILRDVIKASPRKGLEVMAYWWGESSWLSDPSSNFTPVHDGGLLVVVDIQLVSEGIPHYDGLVEMLVKQKSMNPRRWD